LLVDKETALTLPTFLGIGSERCGTTWLYEILLAHPDVYVPHQRKEIHFFDRYYDRGIGWYEQFFPSDEQAGNYQAIGEITPSYLYCDECVERIRKLAEVGKLLVMVRNPIDRAYSAYWFTVRIRDFSGSFEEFLSAEPSVIEWGFYSRYIERYLRYFDREQILILQYEAAVKNVMNTKSKLGQFLSVDPARFPPDAGARKVNRSYLPKARKAYVFAINVANYLRERDVYWAINLFKRLGIKKVFGAKEDPLPPMREATRERLSKIYEDESRALGEFLSKTSLS